MFTWTHDMSLGAIASRRWLSFPVGEKFICLPVSEMYEMNFLFWVTQYTYCHVIIHGKKWIELPKIKVHLVHFRD